MILLAMLEITLDYSLPSTPTSMDEHFRTGEGAVRGEREAAVMMGLGMKAAVSLGWLELITSKVEYCYMQSFDSEKKTFE